MISLKEKRSIWISAMIALLLLPGVALAAIPGITGPSFNLTAKSGSIIVDDGSVIYMWGYANGVAQMQYPGPTLIVTEGDAVTITLTNQLTVPVSIVFPGQTGVTAAGGTLGLLTNEATIGTPVTYSFTAGQPGTYTYYSGTQPELQVEMGLIGTLIVRPIMGPKFAYNDATTAFDREYLFFLSEVDHLVHQKALLKKFDQINNTDAYPVYWFINGRAGMDTVVGNGDPMFPSQPYGALVAMNPTEKVLVRMVGGGRDLHPLHLHGNHSRLIARDGRLLESAGSILSEGTFTVSVGPGQTFDELFTWTGKDVGWDVFGTVDANPHTCTPDPDGFDAVTREWCADHNKPLPVILPDIKDILLGPLYTGSPLLGGAGTLPPGEGGFNPFNAYAFMWHSHSEKELTSNNIFPGGMLTWALVVPPGVLAPE